MQSYPCNKGGCFCWGQSLHQETPSRMSILLNLKRNTKKCIKSEEMIPVANFKSGRIEVEAF